MAALLPVAFHGDTHFLVEIECKPFTPVRPICEAIGVAKAVAVDTLNRVETAEREANYA